MVGHALPKQLLKPKPKEVDDNRVGNDEDNGDGDGDGDN